MGPWPVASATTRPPSEGDLGGTTVWPEHRAAALAPLPRGPLRKGLLAPLCCERLPREEGALVHVSEVAAMRRRCNRRITSSRSASLAWQFAILVAKVSMTTCNSAPICDAQRSASFNGSPRPQAQPAPLEKMSEALRAMLHGVVTWLSICPAPEQPDSLRLPSTSAPSEGAMAEPMAETTASQSTPPVSQMRPGARPTRLEPGSHADTGCNCCWGRGCACADW